MDKILEEIILNTDTEYKLFQAKLIPGVNNILGLRGPIAKSIAKRNAEVEIAV